MDPGFEAILLRPMFAPGALGGWGADKRAWLESKPAGTKHLLRVPLVLSRVSSESPAFSKMTPKASQLLDGQGSEEVGVPSPKSCFLEK